MSDEIFGRRQFLGAAAMAAGWAATGRTAVAGAPATTPYVAPLAEVAGKVAFIKSTDDGATWTTPQVIAGLQTVGVTDPNTGERVLFGEYLTNAQGEDVVASLMGVADRSAAEALKGATVRIRRAHFPPLQDNEFYWIDLIGHAVDNLRGESLGQVV